LCKYADDTYIIIPSVNIDSRLEELAHVEASSQTNNLTLNRAILWKLCSLTRDVSEHSNSHQLYHAFVELTL